MPDKRSIQLLEIQKRYALMERNLLSATQNINLLTMEIERLRNFLDVLTHKLSQKDGMEDLMEMVQTHEQPRAPVPEPQNSTKSNESVRRGPMSSKQGRTLKVINN
jgi:hypothetical protein